MDYKNILLWKQGINPKTKRRIKIEGPTWNKLLKDNSWQKFIVMSDKEIDEHFSSDLNKKLDKFFTKPDVAQMCIDMFLERIEVGDNMLIEPSCGTGSFLIPLRQQGFNVIGIDIKPEIDDAITTDFFETTKQSLNLDGPVHVIGNPPFGRQSSLAKKFITHSSRLGATSISFILPKSFKKVSMTRIFPRNYHQIESIDLPKDSFILDGKSYDVPCVFQIWEKREERRKKIEKVESNIFTYVKKEEFHDFTIQRVGSKASKLTIIGTENKSKQSNYFIRLNEDILLEKFVIAYSKIEFVFDNSVGPKSLSKQELNIVVNNISL